jgi:hypothetical protein
MSANEPTTGQKIGTIIKDAVSTAIPLVGTIMDALGLANKKDGDKITKEQVKSSLDAARDQWVKDAQANVKPIASVAKELSTMGSFMQPATDASKLLSEMQTILSTTPQPTEQTWSAMKDLWALASPLIQQLKAIPDADINQIADKQQRKTLADLKALNNLAVARLGQIMTNKDAGKLPDAIGDMSKVLDTINQAVFFEISDLQSEMEALATWAKGTAAPPSAPKTGDVVGEAVKSLQQKFSTNE